MESPRCHVNQPPHTIPTPVEVKLVTQLLYTIAPPATMSLPTCHQYIPGGRLAGGQWVVARTACQSHLLRNSIHPFTRQLQADLQQLLGNVRLGLLQIFPFLPVQHPRNAIALRRRRRGSIRAREERQLPARGARDNELRELTLRQDVFRFEDANLEEVKAIRAVAAVVKDSAGAVLLAFEERGDARPEVFVHAREI